MTNIYFPVIALLCLGIDFRAFRRDPESIYIFTRLCFTLIIGVGVVYVNLIEVLYRYKFVLRDLDVLQTSYIIGYVCMVAGAKCADVISDLFGRRRKAHTKSIPVGVNAEIDRGSVHALVALGWLSVGMIGLYVLSNGVSFGQSGYESRYEDAQGNGIFLLFFPAFLPYATYRMTAARGGGEFWRVALLTILLAAFTYVALQGYRQILIAVLLLITILGIKRGYINTLTLILVGVIFGPGLILGLAFLRYSSELSSPFRDGFEAALYYVQGDLFPVDAPLRTYWYCSMKECPGPIVIWNHFTKIIPRFLWPDKPNFLQDAAGFYTVVVIGYGRFVTLSATILGEAYMIGSSAIGPIMLAAGLITKFLTILMRQSVGVLRYVLLANVYMGFFWIREGIGPGLYRVFSVFLFCAAALLLRPLFSAVLRSMSSTRKKRLT